MLESDVRSELEKLAVGENYEFTVEELDQEVEYYTNEYLKNVTGYAGKIGFILLDAKGGFRTRIICSA